MRANLTLPDLFGGESKIEIETGDQPEGVYVRVTGPDSGTDTRLSPAAARAWANELNRAADAEEDRQQWALPRKEIEISLRFKAERTLSQAAGMQLWSHFNRFQSIPGHLRYEVELHTAIPQDGSLLQEVTTACDAVRRIAGVDVQFTGLHIEEKS